MNRRFLVIALALWLVRTMVGCGAPAAPQPPSLNLPTPVLDLSAARIDNSVRLAWTMPRRTTDRLPLKHPVTVQVCRSVEGGSCITITSLTLAPGAAGAYSDTLPADLVRGADRLLRYEVSVQNHAGKSAGPSNAAFSAAGPAPAALTGLTGRARPEGVLLSWVPAPEREKSVTFRIDRLQLTAPARDEAPKSPLASPVPAAAQTLAARGHGVDPGHAVDNSTLSNQRYRYLVERVATLQLSGHSVEVQGMPSEAVEVSTKDEFPPAVPQGLVAIADAAAGAIDLSWSPDTDNDLAAYSIYRRDVQLGTAPKRIASVGAETSFRDSAVEVGHTYAYSVSAIDQSGNESKPSPEVQETLPNRSAAQ